jgi:prepilin-type N-terminal cleavage/methylation domain-containing protein/prepilin-type processing-associated H-X9-DG protein
MRYPFVFRAATRRAFTLIELLTVIAIIGILAAIIIPTVGKVRETARASQCVSNFRQIGMGIQLYTQDNQQRLPGPLYTGQGPNFSPTTTPGVNGQYGSLADYIKNYVTANMGGTTATSRSQEMLNCPAWSTQTPDRTGPSVQMNLFPSFFDNKQPFGDANTTNKPLTVGAISSYNLSRTWLLADVDKAWLNGGTPGWVNQIPLTAVHGSKRNVLYYDGHVSGVSASLLPAALY